MSMQYRHAPYSIGALGIHKCHDHVAKRLERQAVYDSYRTLATTRHRAYGTVAAGPPGHRA